MPIELSRHDRNLLLGGGLTLLLLVGLALAFGTSHAEQAKAPSSYSSSSAGAKAAYLLLTDAGYRARRFEQPLSELPPADGKILILAEPQESPTREEREGVRAFLDEGGRVIATGMFAGTYLPRNESVPDPLSAIGIKTSNALSPSSITRAAPQIALVPQSYWRLPSFAYPLYGDGRIALVVRYSVGRGEVLWWASATPLTNAGLKEKGNLEFFLACLGEPKNEVLFDEYVHGYRQTLGGSVAHSPVKWLFVQLAVLALAIVATFSRRHGPTCAPTVDVRLSPMEFVYTLGGIYQRAGKASTAVGICYRLFRYSLTRQMGVASNMPVEELDEMIRSRLGLTNNHFLATLTACEAADLGVALKGPAALGLLQDLDGYAVRLNVYPGMKEGHE